MSDLNEARLLRSYENGPRIWDATAILPTVHALADKGLIEPVGDHGAYQLTESGRRALESYQNLGGERHRHEAYSQALEHSHQGGAIEHGYFDHPEDPVHLTGTVPAELMNPDCPACGDTDTRPMSGGRWRCQCCKTTFTQGVVELSGDEPAQIPVVLDLSPAAEGPAWEFPAEPAKPAEYECGDCGDLITPGHDVQQRFHLDDGTPQCHGRADAILRRPGHFCCLDCKQPPDQLHLKSCATPTGWRGGMMAVPVRRALLRSGFGNRKEAEEVLPKIQRFLPSNYRAWLEFHMKWEIVIQGRDNHGWTLDGYVIPRLASGLYFAEELHEK